MKLKILPSVMAQNQEELDALLKKLKKASQRLHLDIADGIFVPGISLNFPFRLSDDFKYEAHLMVANPEKRVGKIGTTASIDTVIFHFESLKSKPLKEVDALFKRVKAKKKRVGIALKPETGVKEIKPFLENILKTIDCILVMTVHPGFYGSEYLKYPLEKIKQIKKVNPQIEVIVDGGMKPETVGDAVKAGADGIVSGSFITKSGNPARAIKKLEKAAKAASHLQINI
ncbi:MAG: hypothetical protein AB1668_04125 [Nanoarchaeota archaeon]